MARRSEHSLEEIRAMVLNTAEEIVAEGGYAALTMRKIAVEIGYTVGSIYMVFENMSDLILHVNGRTLDRIAEEIEQVVPDSDETCLEALAKLYLRYASRNYHRWSLIFEHRLPKGANIPEWYRDKIESVFERFENEFAKLLPTLDDGDNKQAARALWAAIHGITMLSLSGKLDVIGVEDAEKSLLLMVRHFLAGWTHAGKTESG